MAPQGFDTRQRQNFRIQTGKSLAFTLSFPARLTALLVVSGGFIIPVSEVNAGAIDTKGIASTVTAQAPSVQDPSVQTPPVQTPPVQAPTAASVIYVNPQTGTDSTSTSNSEAAPYKTITYALNQAQPGTVIQLAPGTYNQESGETFPLLIKQGVTLRGDESTKGQGVLITGSGVYISPTFARQNMTIRADKDSTITGVTVTNPQQRGTGIWVESTNPIITNSTFTNSVRDGVFVTGQGNPKIENNVFVQNKGNGISVAKSATGEIRNNLFQDTGFGLAIGGTSTPLVEGNQIIGNQDGLFISESAKPVLRKNVIQKNKRDGIVVITNASPDLGTAESPGGNLIRSNIAHDVNNSKGKNTIVAIGNDIDPKRILGQVEFVAAKVEPSAGGPVAFKDLPANYWAKSYIEALASKNIIAGFPDGTFKPDEPVTRAQFAAIVTKAFAPTAKRQVTNFSDVASNFWGFQVIQSAYQGGFVSGYPDRSFKPQQQIPRVQVLVSLASGMNLSVNNQNVLSIYNDASQIPNYATNSVAAATAQQLVINYPTVKELNPNRQATRAEVAAFVYQALVSKGSAKAIPSPYLVRTP